MMIKMTMLQTRGDKSADTYHLARDPSSSWELLSILNMWSWILPVSDLDLDAEGYL